MNGHLWNKRALLRAGAALTLAISIGGVSSAHANTSDPVQDELDTIMELQPGGVQVSDNAVVWGDGDVVYVVPDAGEEVAPEGLGDNVIAKKLTTKSLKSLAEVGESSPNSVSSADSVMAASANTCPHGIGVKDYYCFYQYSNYEGRRIQFTGATSAGRAADWGFNNITTSWVSWDVDCKVTAYTGASWATPLWTQPENTRSPYVGSANDNRMSSWRCN